MFKDSINKAKKCLKTNDVPVYSCIFKNEKIIIEAINTKRFEKKISSHAEINCINKAFKKLNTENLSDFNIFTTLEPCEMCYWAIKSAKIKKIYYLLDNKKFGHNSNLPVNEKSIKMIKIYNEKMSTEYKEILNFFFKNKR